jgi:acyl dehydratase
MIKLDPDLLGKEMTVGTFSVDAEQIRAFAEAVGDLNPLYLDTETARQAGYPNVIAPPMFCMQMRGGRMVPDVALEPGLVSLHAGQELEFYDEICAGQTYTTTAKIAEVYEKTGRSGPLGVIVREVTIKDTAGRAVVLLRERQMVRSPERRL